jgi:hypothetical protein
MWHGQPMSLRDLLGDAVGQLDVVGAALTLLCCVESLVHRCRDRSAA